MVKMNEVANGNIKTYHTEFSSLNEAVAHYKQSKVTGIFKSNQTSIEKDYSKNPWAGTQTFDEALQLLNNGWSEGSKKLTAQLKVANTKKSQEVKRAVHDIVGFQASVPRYLQGIPTNMINQKPIKRKQKVINLYKSVCYPGSVRPEQILKDSVKTVQILQALESKGIRVNMFAMFHAEHRSERIVYKFKIKSASERLNLSKMSFPLMHPAFLRRLIFKLMETDNRLKHDSWCNGHGTPANARDTENEISSNDKHGYFIPASISESEALRKLNEVTEIERLKGEGKWN